MSEKTESQNTASPDLDFMATIEQAENDAPLFEKLKRVITLSGLTCGEENDAVEEFQKWFEGYYDGRLTEVYRQPE